MSKFSPGSPDKYFTKDREKLLKQVFPGFEVCMKMMLKHDPQMMEDGYFSLVPHAAEYLEQLIAEFQRPEYHSLRYWLIELIGQAKSPAAIPFLVEQLYCHEDMLRAGAIYALKDLDTKEARTILWQARSYKFESEEETRVFQADLTRILDRRE